jgi:hypothetical protein
MILIFIFKLIYHSLRVSKRDILHTFACSRAGKTFSIKGQIGKCLGFAGYTLSLLHILFSSTSTFKNLKI